MVTRKKYLLIFGTRPEAIKMAPVVRALKADPHAECVVCVTGQHKELLASVLSQFGILPEYDLHAMSDDQQACQLMARLLPQLAQIVAQVSPDWVLVQGDTNSALAGAMASFYSRIRLAHVEAGLRSGNRVEPFPEEMNRKMIDGIADLHFAATERDKNALLREGIGVDSIYVTGNTCIDAMRLVANEPFDWEGSRLRRVPRGEKRLILVTVHRRENHGARLESICRAIALLAERFRDSVHFVLPVHPNPNVAGKVRDLLGRRENVSLLAALGYREMIALAEACYFAMVDSGGLQEELPSLGKPALVLRHVTDRPDAIDAGAAKLTGTQENPIVAAFTELMEDPELYGKMAQRRDIYGDGRAADRIVTLLQKL